ncbi:unnamed protein product [Alternaria alternata]
MIDVMQRVWKTTLVYFHVIAFVSHYTRDLTEAVELPSFRKIGDLLKERIHSQQKKGKNSAERSQRPSLRAKKQ